MATPHSTRARLTLVFSTALMLAAAAQAQPTLSKVFTPDTIGPGNVSTITFTITNPTGSPITGVELTDVLPTVPGDVDIADPANASTSCDDGIVTAPDGGGTISLSGAEVGAGASCTVRVDVTAGTAGVHTNPGIPLIYNELMGDPPASLPIDLTVVTTLPGFSKSFAPASVSLGDRSTLTFTVDNTANASGVADLSFTDNLPTGMEIADPTNASTDCVSATPLLTTTLTAVPGTGVIILVADGTSFGGNYVVAAGASCTVTVDVVATGTGMLDNVTNELLADFVSSGKASATLEVTVTPLAIQKSFTDDPTPPGSAVTLEFTIDNFDRDFSATGVAFTDDLTTLVPALAGLTFASLLSNDCGGSVSGVGGTTIGFTGGTLAPEASCTISVSLSVPAAATPASYTNTTSTVTGTVDGSPVVGNTASDDLFVEPVPLLTKEFMGDPVNPGDTIVLEFTATNTSTTSSATDVAFQDLFETVLATASATPGNGCCGGGSICTFTPLLNLPGSSVVPATLTISGGTLAPAGMPGDSCTFSVTLDVGIDAAPGIYPNTTTEITATVDGATRTGEPASDTLTVIAAPQLTKEFTDDPVAPGGTATLEFVLTYPADASGDATDISFTDDLAPVLASLVATGLPLNDACDPDGPGGDPGTGTLSGSVGETLLTFIGGTLSPGESCAFSVALDVPLAAAPGDYGNTTSGVGATVEGLPATSVPAEDSLKVAGLSFTKEFLGDPVIPGDTVTLRFTIENIDPTDDATDIAFTDDLAAVLPGAPDITAVDPPTTDTCNGTPSGTTSLTYQLGSLLNGQTCTVEYTINVPAGASDGSYSNLTSNLTATMGGGGVTIVPATDDLTVNSNLLQLTKAFTDDPVAPGGTVTLEFTLTNLDEGQAASDIDFTDNLDDALTDLTFDSVLLNDCGGTVSGTTTTMITVSGVSLGIGGSCTLRVSLSVPVDAAASIYTNTTSDVTGTIGGFAVTGDAASDDLEVIQLLDFSKSFDGPTTATGAATLTFTITNPGTDTATDIEFSDNLDDVIPGLIATSLPALPCGAGSSIAGIGFLTFTGGELPPSGGMCSFDVDVLVPATATAGSFPNVTSDLFQFGLTVADPATADLTIEPPPTFAKSFAPDAIGFGQVSTLTFTVDNSASTLAAGSLAFTDNLPAGVAVATPSVTANTCGGTLTATAGSGVTTLSGGSVGAGSTCTVDVDVTGTAIGAHVNTTEDLTSSSGSSGTATDTLTVQDLDPPVVTDVSTAAGPLAACDTVRQPITSIQVTIEDDVTPVLNADDPASYLLVRSGPDGDFSTTACGPVGGDDLAVEIVSLTLTSVDPIVVDVGLGFPGGLGDGLYSFLVCDTITDSAGNALDGDGDSNAGGDFVIPFFRADQFNLFDNGHFDDCSPVTLDPWVTVVTPPNDLLPGTPGADDSESSPLSASARASHTSAEPSALAQCVQVQGGAEQELRARVRFEPQPGGVARFEETCEFFAGAACTGAGLSSVSIASVLEDEGGAWLFLTDGITVPGGATSALCDFTVETAGGPVDFDAYLDGLFLGTGAAIFTDGFESGDVTAWSSSVP